MSENFIWSQTKTREMFQKYHLWPSFIGSRNDPFSESSGLLPMLVWGEQARYLDEQKAIELQEEFSTNSSRKRKLADTFESSDQVNVDDADASNFSVRKFLKSIFGFRSIAPSKPSDESKATSTTTSLATKQSVVVDGHTKHDYTIKTFGSAEQKQHDMTFKFLQSEGFFVGPADVYGGDYSIYRGADPTESHATATIRICDMKTMPARELLAFSRIQNQVAKSSVITYADPSSAVEVCLLCVNKNKKNDKEISEEKEGEVEGKEAVDDSESDAKATNNPPPHPCVICERIAKNDSTAPPINFVVVNFKSVSDRLPMY
jgi:tRNA splicing endonuclease